MHISNPSEADCSLGIEVPQIRLFFKNDTINPTATRQSRIASKAIDLIAVRSFQANKENVSPNL